MKTIKGVMPLKFKFKKEETREAIRFIDNKGEYDFDCIRYIYFKLHKLLIYYPIGYDMAISNNREVISAYIDIDIETVIYKHYNTLNI